MSEGEDPLEFISSQVEEDINHIVRQSSDLKGVVSIEVRNDGNFNIKLHKGSEHEITTIEAVSKDRLLDLLDEQL